MEPPPRRDKLSVVFKKLQSAHTECLSRKNQLELDFLNKMKNYSKQRSQLELDYGLALQRLSHQSQMDPQVCEDLGYSNRSLYAVWNSYLEDCSNVGKQHQSLSHFYAQNMGDNLKALCANKTETARKCLEKLGRCHHYLQLAVKELERTRRDYYVARTSFEESSNKAESLREKLQKKNQGLFQSREQMEKDYEKYSQRRDEAWKQSIYNRNMYLVQLEAVKNHQEHYRTVELPTFSQEIEQGLFDQVWTYLSAVVAIEKENYQTIEKAIATLFKEVEQETALCSTPETEHSLLLEARKWVVSSMRHKAAVEETKKKLHQLTQLQIHAWEARKNTNNAQDAGMLELGRKIEEMKDGMRREELMSFKAERVLEFFKKSGVNVEELLAKQSIPEVPSVSSFPVSRSRRSSLSQASSDGSNVETRNSNSFYTVLYDYQAQRSDELTLTKGEEVTLFEDPAEVPWPRGESSSGQTGLIPSNYVQKLTRDSSQQHSPRVSNASSSPRSPRKKPPTTKKPVFNLTHHDGDTSGPTQVTGTQSSNIMAEAVCFVECVLDYEGDMPDEVSFQERDHSDIIGVLDREPNGMDDGWWMGQVLRTGQGGTFLAIMTQEIGRTQAQETIRRLNLTSSIKRRSRSSQQLASTGYGTCYGGQQHNAPRKNAGFTLVPSSHEAKRRYPRAVAVPEIPDDDSDVDLSDSGDENVTWSEGSLGEESGWESDDGAMDADGDGTRPFDWSNVPRKKKRSPFNPLPENPQI